MDGKKFPEIHKKDYYLLNTTGGRGEREKNAMTSKNQLRGLREIRKYTLRRVTYADDNRNK